MKYLTLLLLLTCGCAINTKRESVLSSSDIKREKIVKCIKNFQIEQEELTESFEVCRQIYGLRKVKEK